MRFRSGVLVLALGLAGLTAPAHADPTFTTFVTGPSIAAAVGGNSTIGFACVGLILLTTAIVRMFLI